MYFYYLKTPDEQSMFQTLVDTNVATLNPAVLDETGAVIQPVTLSPVGNNSFDLIGAHSERTGGTDEEPIYTVVEGYHANVITSQPVTWPAGVFQNLPHAPWRGWSGNPSSMPDDVEAAIVAKRYEKEVAGFIWNGYLIATDREVSQGKLDSERFAVRDGLRVENRGWKCFDLAAGQMIFRPTTNAEMGDITARAYHYISDCYAREDELIAAHRAGTFTLDQLDASWPSRGL